jgi:hypothetical protein
MTIEASTIALAPTDGPLAGIRVFDVSRVYAASITVMLLGDCGADVLKIGHPMGNAVRTHGCNREGHGLWAKVISRNERTITLNFSTPEGQKLRRRLAADADVLVENFRPGTIHRGHRRRFDACSSEGSSSGRPHARPRMTATRPVGTGLLKGLLVG